MAESAGSPNSVRSYVPTVAKAQEAAKKASDEKESSPAQAASSSPKRSSARLENCMNDDAAASRALIAVQKQPPALDATQTAVIDSAATSSLAPSPARLAHPEDNGSPQSRSPPEHIAGRPTVANPRLTKEPKSQVEQDQNADTSLTASQMDALMEAYVDLHDAYAAAAGELFRQAIRKRSADLFAVSVDPPQDTTRFSPAAPSHNIGLGLGLNLHKPPSALPVHIQIETKQQTITNTSTRWPTPTGFGLSSQSEAPGVSEPGSQDFDERLLDLIDDANQDGDDLMLEIGDKVIDAYNDAGALMEFLES